MAHLKDREAVRALGEKQAQDKTEAGGVKALTLLAILLNNKYDKKGEGDLVRNFFVKKLGHTWTPPDIHNSCYRLNGDFAKEIVLYLNLFIEYLGELQD